MGNTVVREIQAVNYPFFVDVRPDGMDKASPIVGQAAGGHAELGLAAHGGRGEKPGPPGVGAAQVVRQLVAAHQPGHPAEPQAVPGRRLRGGGRARRRGRWRWPCAARSRARSRASRRRPQPSQPPASGQQAPAATPTPAPQTGSVIEASPDTARLVVIGSSEFLTDMVFQISGSMSGDRYLNSLQLLQNAVDWSVEDLDLLGIRARGASARVLKPMAAGDQTVWEVLNYGIALAGADRDRRAVGGAPPQRAADGAGKTITA